jgi:hypothetical protein
MCVVVLFSYGEIDCRCHAQKWVGDAESLTVPYINSIHQYVADFMKTRPLMRAVPIVLAVPPATDEGYNPEVPRTGELPLRITATHSLNSSLESVCSRHGVAFTGASTWDFAKDEYGALHRSLYDGHVNVDSRLCGPVHERLRSLILESTGPG